MPFQKRGVGLGAAGSAAPEGPSDWPKADATLAITWPQEMCGPRGKPPAAAQVYDKVRQVSMGICSAS
jgi:hypothetical protein